jgi:hypothetical protein
MPLTQPMISAIPYPAMDDQSKRLTMPADRPASPETISANLKP